jgi:hypothetical protein
MNLQVEWNPPLAMRRVRSLTYKLDLEKIPDVAGVYVFGRRWGNSFEALYVGKARNVHARVKGQLNNLRLMSHIRDAKAGNRIVMVGSIITRPGQQIDKCLTLVEHSLIRNFLSEGDDLVNVQGTQLRRHEIASVKTPRWFVRNKMFLDKDR